MAIDSDTSKPISSLISVGEVARIHGVHVDALSTPPCAPR